MFYLLGIGIIFLLWWIGHGLQPNKIPSITTVFKLLFNESLTENGINRNLARLLASGEHAFLGLLLKICLVHYKYLRL